MRFRRRMAAAILAVAMTATSVQGPGGVSYAAELKSGSMESGQEALEPAAKAALEQGSGSVGEKDAVPGSEEGQENGAAASEGEAQPDEGAAANGDNQAEEETELALYSGGVSGLFQFDGRLFYNDTISIYSIAKDGTDEKTVFTLPNTEVRSIRGSAYCGGKVVYVLYDSLTEELEVLTADIAGLSWYSIHYKLDGGVNDSGNPGSYTSESETITLKAPTKEGYRFGGWYKDAECQEEMTQIGRTVRTA